MNRKLYPDDWREISQAVRERVGGRCQMCGAEENLTVAHLDHDERTNHVDARLAALCARCHLSYDNRTLFSGGDSPSADTLPGVAWEVSFVRISEIRAALTCEVSPVAARA